MNMEQEFLKVIRDNQGDESFLLVYADWLEEKGRQKDAESVRKELSVSEAASPDKLKGYDWKHAFAYAGEPCDYGSPNVERALPNDEDISVDTFSRSDVEEVIHCVEGENDVNDWIVVGKLRDGRFFALSAWCDYTGWD